jgi:hypothetical protein
MAIRDGKGFKVLRVSSVEGGGRMEGRGIRMNYIRLCASDEAALPLPAGFGDEHQMRSGRRSTA